MKTLTESQIAEKLNLMGFKRIDFNMPIELTSKRGICLTAKSIEINENAKGRTTVALKGDWKHGEIGLYYRCFSANEKQKVINQIFNQ